MNAWDFQGSGLLARTVIFGDKIRVVDVRVDVYDFQRYNDVVHKGFEQKIDIDHFGLQKFTQTSG